MNIPDGFIDKLRLIADCLEVGDEVQEFDEDEGEWVTAFQDFNLVKTVKIYNTVMYRAKPADPGPSYLILSAGENEFVQVTDDVKEALRDAGLYT